MKGRLCFRDGSIPISGRQYAGKIQFVEMVDLDKKAHAEKIKEYSKIFLQ